MALLNMDEIIYDKQSVEIYLERLPYKPNNLKQNQIKAFENIFESMLELIDVNKEVSISNANYKYIEITKKIDEKYGLNNGIVFVMDNEDFFRVGNLVFDVDEMKRLVSKKKVKSMLIKYKFNDIIFDRKQLISLLNMDAMVKIGSKYIADIIEDDDEINYKTNSVTIEGEIDFFDRNDMKFKI